MRLIAGGFILLSAIQAQTLTVAEAVDRAIKNYASVQVSQEQVTAAAAGIQLARTAYLPRADLYGQFNRASRNNVFGMLLPNSTLPSISGPPRPENDMASVWGSAAGLMVSWEPFDFGLRKANVAVAESARRRAEFAQKRTEFEVAAMAADAYLTVLAAEATVVSAKASVERAKVLETVVGALARSELRPGADESRARAERASAQTQLIQAEQAVAVAMASLKQFVGEDSRRPETLKAPPGLAAEAGVAGHPAVAEQSAAVDESKARQKALAEMYVPKFSLIGASYARGTGANPDGTILGGVNGLGPNIFNYGVGLAVTFPVLSLPSIRAQRAEEAAKGRAETARQRQLTQDLNAELDRAKAKLDGARRVAEQTPVQLEAARAADQQATARYKAGLGAIAEVADAQRLLTQAETDDALARLAIWRGLLYVATAQGDLTSFLQAAR